MQALSLQENEGGARIALTEERKKWQREYYAKNAEKMRAHQKAWRDKHSPEFHSARTRRYYLPNTYGITVEEYETMLQSQNNACAICSTTTPTGKWKVFAVDHCHKTGRARGLLCNECNRGMGLLGDSPERLQKAVDYLIKTKEENS